MEPHSHFMLSVFMAVGETELKEMRNNLDQFHQRYFISLLSRTFCTVFAEKI